jgi:ABC-type multidrug transport system ATPase subunit
MDLCSRMAIIHLGKVLFEGHPDDAISTLKGRVWQRSISKSELAEYQQRYQVISSRLMGGRPFLHVLSVQPPDAGFAPSAPDLEDVFFTKIRGWN